MRKFVALMGVFAVLLLTGCNTVHGIGKDIEKGGEAIQKVAK
ncbi:MAG TPA: entericidin A/B family lipoprotein [Zoogloea sp.]|nr:entericidin A/B family lipoprotein [Zoogloea sp.]HMV18247.1 entericidin A/B family lipoprotein [Rhodocyclaceae bacterium]HMV63629.1 entericidin A/B family lipoprotein [Rhodocyclaceae bacterium]HMW51502.1 entericidin A/B family lipoprotein [Rhodocyclaceae bacterium]HMY49517.1 entericidin A/B family lipoprotein [Rhodocyclaceae bacterium]HMZ76798.1 entericidin A/B family lipoprotein [Rhodocyclaceae bacterium]